MMVTRMAEGKEKSTPNLFLPLRGNENRSRLEAKFEHYYDSDEDETEQRASKSKGKVSEWKPSEQQPWLYSPVKSSRKTPVAMGGQVRSPSYLRKRKKRQETQASTSKSPRRSSLDSNFNMTQVRTGNAARQDITEYSSGEEENQRAIGSTKNQKLTPALDMEISKQSPRMPRLSESVHPQSATVENKFLSVWNEFSETDTKRPCLSVEPVSANVDFLLSKGDTEPRVAVPASINQYLRDYQREGIRFLYQHYEQSKGAILGDDMGLGKTIQVIGLLAALLGKTGNNTDALSAVPKFIKQMSDDFPDTPPRRAIHPFLIIGPTAVLFNWLDELKTWGYFSSGKYHGVDKDTCLSDVKKGKLEVVVTTFETFRDNVEQINQIEWEAVFVDEVHKIKGLRAQVTQALRIIKTPRRFGLTGTALQNNMTELWSLLDWAQPRVLGNLEQFDNEFVRVIELGQRHDATKRELALARKQRDKFAVTRRKMFLRRTKALIADQLPKKEELVVMCRPAELQVSVYKAILNHPDMALVLQAEDPCDCGRAKQRASCCYKRRADGTKIWSLVFSYMHLMLKAANHVGLLIPESQPQQLNTSINAPSTSAAAVAAASSSSSFSKPSDQLAWSVFQAAFRDQPQFVELTRSAAFRTLSDPRHCGKMKILQGLLKVFEKNHDKVLVFSYSTKLLDIIEHYVISQGYEYSRIDGKVGAQRRREVVLKFNADPNLFICLISTKAGGLGLNLTGANRVVIFDPNWNPSHDLQAQDRAYRIGQTRDVKVFRLISAGTIEENIYLRQIYKQQLDEVAIGNNNARRYFHGIQGDKNNQGELFGVKNMFALRTGDVCLTMDILKRNERLEKGLQGFDITEYVPPPIKGSDAQADVDTESDVAETGDAVDEEEEPEETEMDESKEDGDFLKEFFGIDHYSFKPSTSMHQSSPGGDNEENNSDSSDDEFSLMPFTSISAYKHKKEMNRNKGKPFGDLSTVLDSSDSKDERQCLKTCKEGPNSGTFDDLFSVGSLTFTTGKTPKLGPISAAGKYHSEYDKDLIEKSKDRRASLRKSGVSWLFFDSDEGSDPEDSPVYEKQDKVTRIEAKRAGPSKVKIGEEGAFVPDVGKDPQAVPSVFGEDSNRAGVEKCMKKDKKQGIQKRSNRDKLGKHKTSFSSEQSLLAAGDVLHSHTNAGLLGASRAEDHMTRCAIKDVFELHSNTQAPALMCDQLSPEQENEEEPKKRRNSRTKGRGRQAVQSSTKEKQEDYDKAHCVNAGRYKLLVGQTPPGIARKQWSQLAKTKGLSELDLAHYVLKSSLGDRLSLLRDFYRQRHPDQAVGKALTQLFSQRSDRETDGKTDQANVPKGNVTPSKRRPTASETSSSRKKSAPSVETSSSRRRLRAAPATQFFLEVNTLASDSQESITASSPPPREPADSDEDGVPDYICNPISPPPKKRVTPNPAKSSAKPRTRLRSSKNSGTPWNEDYEENTLVNDNPEQSITHQQTGLKMHSCTASFMQNLRLEDDIPSLLWELGGGGGGPEGTSLQQGSKSPVKNSAPVAKNKLVVTNEPIPGPSKLSTGPNPSLSDLKEPDKPKSQLTKTSPADSKTTPGKRRNVARVLDDIFGDSLGLPSSQTDRSKKSCPGKKQLPSHSQVSFGETAKHSDKSMTTTEACRVKKRSSKLRSDSDIERIDLTRCVEGASNKRPTPTKSPSMTGKERDQPRSPSISNIKRQVPARDSRVNVKVNAAVKSVNDVPVPDVSKDADCSDDDDPDILNTFLNTSTFRDESPLKSTKSATAMRKRQGAVTSTSPCISRRVTRPVLEYRDDGEDFDNLDNLGNLFPKSLPLNDSESLFS